VSFWTVFKIGSSVFSAPVSWAGSSAVAAAGSNAGSVVVSTAVSAGVSVEKSVAKSAGSSDGAAVVSMPESTVVSVAGAVPVFLSFRI